MPLGLTIHSQNILEYLDYDGRALCSEIQVETENNPVVRKLKEGENIQGKGNLLDGVFVVIPIVPLMEITLDTHSAYVTAAKLCRMGARVRVLFLDLVPWSYAKKMKMGFELIHERIKKQVEYFDSIMGKYCKKHNYGFHHRCESELAREYSSKNPRMEILYRTISMNSKQLRGFKDYKFGTHGQDANKITLIQLSNFLTASLWMKELLQSDDDCKEVTMLIGTNKDALIDTILDWKGEKIGLKKENILYTLYPNKYLEYSEIQDRLAKGSKSRLKLYCIEGWKNIDLNTNSNRFSENSIGPNFEEYRLLCGNGNIFLQYIACLFEVKNIKELNAIQLAQEIQKSINAIVKPKKAEATPFDKFRIMLLPKSGKKKYEGANGTLVTNNFVLELYFAILWSFGHVVDKKHITKDKIKKMEHLPSGARTLKNLQAALDILVERNWLKEHGEEFQVVEHIFDLSKWPSR